MVTAKPNLRIFSMRPGPAPVAWKNGVKFSPPMQRLPSLLRIVSIGFLCSPELAVQRSLEEFAHGFF
jgi:hypothetical protein